LNCCILEKFKCCPFKERGKIWERERRKMWNLVVMFRVLVLMKAKLSSEEATLRRFIRWLFHFYLPNLAYILFIIITIIIIIIIIFAGIYYLEQEKAKVWILKEFIERRLRQYKNSEWKKNVRIGRAFHWRFFFQISERSLAGDQWETPLVPSSAATLPAKPVNEKRKMTRKSLIKRRKKNSAIQKFLHPLYPSPPSQRVNR